MRTPARAKSKYLKAQPLFAMRVTCSLGSSGVCNISHPLLRDHWTQYSQSSQSSTSGIVPHQDVTSVFTSREFKDKQERESDTITYSIFRTFEGERVWLVECCDGPYLLGQPADSNPYTTWSVPPHS